MRKWLGIIVQITFAALVVIFAVSALVSVWIALKVHGKEVEKIILTR